MTDQRHRRYFSIQESAAYWGVSSMTIRRRIADGSLPAARIGSTIRIKADDLEAAGRRIPAAVGAR
jgi:excisionase family DNA binding protein